jgi:rubrerythrin
MNLIITESQLKKIIKEYNDGGADYIKCDNCYGVGRTFEGEMCPKCDGTGKMSPNSRDLKSDTDRFLNSAGSDTFAGASPPDGPNTSLTEKIEDNKVICDKCGWSWDLKDGGKDPYTCHKCGHNNNLAVNGGIKPSHAKFIEDMNKGAKFITCRNCRHKFTQTTHKKKKSLPICPICSTMNHEHR